jgi:predicted metal-dependent phosphoesterase TrpH
VTAGDDRHGVAGSADLHVHPHGDRRRRHDGSGVVDRLLAVDLDVVVLTNHDDVRSGEVIAARAREAGARAEIVVGAEVTTLDGHLLGLWLTHDVPRDRSLAETVERIHDQGGLAIVAHPLLPTRVSAPGRLVRRLADGPAASRPDAIEGYNAIASWVPLHRRRLARLGAVTALPLVGGSDAHHPRWIGLGRTTFVGRTAAELRASIVAGTCAGTGRGHGVRDIARNVINQLPDLRLRA